MLARGRSLLQSSTAALKAAGPRSGRLSFGMKVPRRVASGIDARSVGPPAPISTAVDHPLKRLYRQRGAHEDLHLSVPWKIGGRWVGCNLQRVILDMLRLAFLRKPDVQPCGVQGSVTQELLNGDEICSHGDVVGGKGVTQSMDTGVLDACSGEVLAHEVLVLAWGDRPQVAGDEQGLRLHRRSQS